MAMESPNFSFGTSLQVPSVQELTKEHMITVPPRYVRPDQDPTIVVGPITSLSEIPIICFFENPAPLNWTDCTPLANTGVSSRETLGAYAVELQKLAKAILGFMARALGMKAEEMKELFEEGLQSIRTNYYPTCPQPELVIGLSPHSDASGLTILQQVSEIEGLQIKKDGMWIPVKPLPNSFTINIGDVLEIVSNGVCRSIEHRATVNSTHERLSIAAFHNPKLTGEIGPAPSLISPQTPPQFRRVSVEKHLKEFFTRKLEGKAYVDYFRIDSGEGNASSN